MTDDRSEMEAARLAGLAKRHEQRLENATYTAAEVKVLTAKARQETADRIASEADIIAEAYQSSANEHRALSIEHRTSKEHGERHFKTALAFKNKADGAWAVAQIAREVASQEPQDATSGRTDPGEDS